MLRKPVIAFLTILALGGAITTAGLARDGADRRGAEHGADFFIPAGGGQSQGFSGRGLSGGDRATRGRIDGRRGLSNRRLDRRMRNLNRNDNDWGFADCYRLKRYHNRTGWHVRRVYDCTP